MRQKLTRRLLFPLLLLAIFLLSLFLLFFYKKEERHFTELTTELFKNEMLQNTLNMHYTIAKPENYGIHSYKAVLPVYSRRQDLLANAQLENYLNAFSQIRSEKLDDEDAYTLRLLNTYLRNTRKAASFDYYAEPLSPGSGMQSQLPILLAEYPFRCKRDVVDYLLLVKQTDAYFDGLLVYEKQKAEAGLFMPDYSLEKVKTQCSVILDKTTLESGTHFLQTTFQERLEELITQNVITPKEAQEFVKANDQLLLTVVLPAYESLSEGLAALKGQGKNPEGLAHFPEGKDFYACLLRQSTGSHRSVKDFQKLLYAQLEKEYNTLQSLLAERPADAGPLSAADAPTFPISASEEMLFDLTQKMQGEFPSFPLSEKESTPTCKVKAVSKSLEPFSAPAFYLTPPIDDGSRNVIYINEQDRPAGLSLYTTLAHEGYPGHLYQSVYNLLYMQKTDQNPARALLWYGGYLEGWALYTEFLSFDYASLLLEEHGQGQAALTYEIEKHNRSLQLCLYSILDIAIHYDGASFEDVAKVLSGFGITDADTQRSIYEYIVEEPANYPKYYLGYLEILLAKEKARSEWGADYSDYRFHKFYLECGPSDFENLNAQIPYFGQERKN